MTAVWLENQSAPRTRLNQALTTSAALQYVYSAATASVNAAGTQQFTAVSADQFGKPMTSQPAAAWAVASGIGAIDPASGLYTAPSLWPPLRYGLMTWIVPPPLLNTTYAALMLPFKPI